MTINNKKTVTSKDVAMLAGVSQSTVSRVFIDGSSTSEETRQKVLKAAMELNYRPNAFARSLTTNESKLIGLVFPDVDYPIHMETLQILSTELQRNGYSAVLIPWEMNEQKQHSIPNIFQYKVDGVIAASAQFNTVLYDECHNFNIPIVQFIRIEEGTHCNSAISDNYSAGKLAAQILIEKGAMRPVYLTGDIPTTTNSERFEGFADGLSEYNVNAEQITASYNYHLAQEKIRQLLVQPQRADAFFCSTDVIAMALMDVARYEFNLSIPEDLQIIGFDNIPQASWTSYQLTTFRQDFPRLAKEAVKIIMNQIKQQDNRIIKLMIPVELVIRNTLRN